MNLDISNWKSFKLKDLFYKFENGKTNQTLLTDGNDSFYVGAKSNNNGVMLHCEADSNLELEGNCIVFICNGQGSVGYANYMDRNFIATIDVTAGYIKDLNYLRGCFIATVLSKERPKYSFGRKWRKYIPNTIIKLPAILNSDGSYIPDWEFMENYIKSLHYKHLTTKNYRDQILDLNVQEWKEFRFGDLIESVYKAKAINKEDLIIASDVRYAIRYITRTGDNNGCELLADVRELDSNIIIKSNVITIGDTTATCFYQDEEFIAGDHIVVVRADTWLNKYTAMFILAILHKEQFKYSYGRAFLMDKIKDTIVKLPSYSDGNPDWQFMENYIKSLPYGDRI